VGKLYDKRDMAFDLDCIDRMEQANSQQILAGTFPAMKAKEALELFAAERQHCKMLYLRSKQLVADLRNALRMFRNCPRCFEDAAGKQKACSAHFHILRAAKRAVHYAVEDNLARRNASGQQRSDEEIHDGSLNEWETWYYKDRRTGCWPGSNADMVAYNQEHFDTLDYRGWLRMMLFNEEIPLEDYVKEQKRLRGEEGL